MVFRDQDMTHATKIAFALIVAALASFSSAASAHGRLYPVTRCGPDLAYFCPIHGYFDRVPFHYDLAVHPGCIKAAPVQTAHGIERRHVLVCDVPQRPMIYW
jgi:hypothetical protein